MVDVGLIIAGIKGTIATAKTAYDLSKQMDNLELRQTLMNLSEELLDVQVKVIELREEISELKEKSKVKEDLSKLKLEDEALIDPDMPGVAYCLKCREDKGTKSLMSEQNNDFKGITGKFYICHNCKHTAKPYVKQGSPIGAFNASPIRR